MNEPLKIGRPIEVSIIAVLHLIFAIAGLVSGISAIVQYGAQWQSLFIASDLFWLALTFASILATALIGWGLWHLRAPVRSLALFLAGCTIILSLIAGLSRGMGEYESTPMRLAWAAVTLIGLNTPRARRSFGKFGRLGVDMKLLMLCIPLVLVIFLVERSKVMLPRLDIPGDVRAITFISDRRVQVEYGISAGSGRGTVLSMDADGNNVGYLKGTAHVLGAGAWSPDGRAFAIESFDPDLDYFCLTIFELGGHRCLVRDGRAPSWSPDSKYIAYSTTSSYSSVPENIRSATINMVEVSSGVTTQLVALPPPQDALGAYINTVTWSPDGKMIAYTMHTVHDTGSIWIVDIATKQPVFLTSGLSPAWSPSRNEIAFIRNEDIFLYDVVTHSETIIVRDPKSAYSPAWSPDGQQLLFTSMRDGNSEIYRINRDGTWPVNLTNNEADDFAPAWHPTP